MTIWNYALVANGAVIYASSSESALPAVHMGDGSDMSYWKSVLGNDGVTVTVDLGSPIYIDNIRVLQNGPRFAQRLTLSYSDDNVDWYTVGTFVSTAGWTTIPLDGLIHRMYRIALSMGSGTGQWYIHTLEVNGPIEAPPPPTNPTEDYIHAWLDGLEANYVPSVQSWLDTH